MIETAILYLAIITFWISLAVAYLAITEKDEGKIKVTVHNKPAASETWAQ